MYLRNKKPAKASSDELKETIFRNMFIEEEDLKITDVIWNYFEAVKKRWPHAWASGGQGMILNKTNGFRALMRVLRPAYLDLTAPGEVPAADEFLRLLKRIKLMDDDFNVETYKPGMSGQSLLYHTLIAQMELKP